MGLIPPKTLLIPPETHKVKKSKVEKRKVITGTKNCKSKTKKRRA